MYIKIPNKYPYELENLRTEYTNTSFPADIKNLGSEVLNSYGIYEVILTDRPEYNHNTHKIIEILPQNINGTWYQTWDVKPLTEQEQQYRISNLSTEARALRNRLLVESDWTQFKDISPQISELWAPYRQQLRDITSQQGFPIEIIWPAPPQ